MRRGGWHPIRPMTGPYPPLGSTIIGIDIPDDVETKLRTKHGVSPQEARQVIKSDSAMWLQDPTRPDNEWCVIGQTKSGRWLRVHGCIYEDAPRAGFFRVFTAFEATAAWQELYNRHKRGEAPC